MLEKFKQEEAFILLESILALSIVSFSLIVILPFSVQLLHARQDRQMAIEGYRTLYDYSYTWRGTSSASLVKRSHFDYRVKQSKYHIQLIMPNGETIDVEVIGQ